MRTRGVPATILAALVAATLTSSLRAAPAPGQRVDGSIRLALPHPVYEDGCLGFGAQYQIAWLQRPEVNGVVGFQFELDERTWGKRYRLVPSDDTADLDIAFFPRFQPLVVTEDYVDDATRGPGGETGIVPSGMTVALVCLYSGSEVSFRYTART